MQPNPYEPPAIKTDAEIPPRRKPKHLLLLACVAGLLAIGVGYNLSDVTTVGVVFGLIWVFLNRR